VSFSSVQAKGCNLQEKTISRPNTLRNMKGKKKPLSQLLSREGDTLEFRCFGSKTTGFWSSKKEMKGSDWPWLSWICLWIPTLEGLAPAVCREATRQKEKTITMIILKLKKEKKREMYRRRGSLGESQCHQEGRHGFLDLSWSPPVYHHTLLFIYFKAHISKQK